MLVVVGAAIAYPTAAAADSLTFQGLGDGAWVTFTAGGQSISGWAGEIEWLLKTPSNTAGKALETYCSDLFDDAKLPTQTGTFETTSALTSATTLGANQYSGARAAYLVNTYAAGATTDAYAAGLQLAIWEAMFGAFTTPITGTSKTGSTVTGIGAYASLFYNDVISKNPTTLTSVAGFFDVPNSLTSSGGNANGQDQITKVPEPGALMLIGLGLTGLLAFQYRLKRQYARVRI
jgi:PEP-CTERM motif-containing protein